MGDQVKGRSPKSLKSLIEIPNVVHVNVHFLTFNMKLKPTSKRVVTKSISVLRNFGR